MTLSDEDKAMHELLPVQEDRIEPTGTGDIAESPAAPPAASVSRKMTASPLVPDEVRAARIARIKARSMALMKAGFYPREDVVCIAEMVKNGMCLVQIEWLLLDAEEMHRGM